MLPFFRKIRFKLAQDNQFLKYSRYAIGEIVLVVIGILIALQINNWNEERKGSIKKLMFQKALIEDLKKDTSKLKSQIRIIKGRIEYSDEFILKMEKEDATVDTIMKLWFTRFYYLPSEFYPNRSAFESLYSTGNIELFSNQDISSLSAFYDFADLEYSQIRLEMEELHQADVELGNKFGWLWKKKKDSHIYKSLRKDFDDREFLRLLDLAIYKDNQNIKRIKNVAEKILRRTDSLIASLNYQIE